MNIGFIGIGNMGVHMARYILEAGYQLYVSDLDKSKGQNSLDHVDLRVRGLARGAPIVHMTGGCVKGLGDGICKLIKHSCIALT